MKLKIMIMALLLVSAVGIGSAVNRLPATEFIGDVEMWGGNVNNATFGNPPGGYTVKVYVKGSGVYSQWDNGTILYSGSAATQSREAIQSAIYAHHGTTLICDMLNIDDDIPIYINWTDPAEIVQHRLVGLGPGTGIKSHQDGSNPIIYAYDADSNPVTRTNCSNNAVVISDMSIFVAGGRDGIKLENLGNGFQGNEIHSLFMKATGATESGAFINLTASGSTTIHDNRFYGGVNPLSDINQQKTGVNIYSTSDQYFTTGVTIQNNNFLYLRNGVHIVGHNLSLYTYCCGFNIINNFILGSDAGIRCKWMDSPIILGNVIDNCNTSVLLYDVHGPQIIGNQLGNRFNIGSSVTERGSIAIYVAELNAPESGAIISNNRMIGYTTTGTYLKGYAQILLYINGGTYSKSQISDNEIRPYNEAGIRITYGSGTCDQTNINGNSISDRGSGEGVHILNAAITNTRVINNILDVANREIYDLGTGTICKLNSGYVTENSGSSTGTGAKQTIAHGLVSTPKRVSVTPTDTGATAAWWADATNIYPSVTNGKTFNWAASTW